MFRRLINKNIKYIGIISSADILCIYLNWVFKHFECVALNQIEYIQLLKYLQLIGFIKDEYINLYYKLKTHWACYYCINLLLN